MRHLLRYLSFLCLSGVLLLASLSPAQATHILGGQITYLNVGPNQYVVNLYMYLDCGGTAMPTTMALAVQSGCSGAAVPGSPFTMSPVPNPLPIVTQYCPAQQAQSQCIAGAALPNYQTLTYRSGPITIPDGQWLLTSEICCRPVTANLVGTDNYRFEAMLNNRVVVNGVNVSVRSSSPQYSALDVPVPFVNAGQSTTIGFNTTDPDNTPLNRDQDSLVYSLVNPLNGCNTSVPYTPYPGSNIIVDPGGGNPPCVVIPPINSPATYAATLPICVSYNITGVCPILQGTTPKFIFSPSVGQFTFTPARFNPGAPSAGLNKYVVVGKVDEYRRLPGSNRRYLIGSVRREILVTVVDGGGNTVPSPPVSVPVTPNSGTVVRNTVDSTFIELQPCSYSQVMLRFTDPNPGQILTVTYTGAGTINSDVLEGGDIGSYTLTGNGTASPVARFQFQPSPAYAGRTLLMPFKITDNSCPTLGLQTRVVVVKIAALRQNLLAVALTGTSGSGTTADATICAGSSLTLRGTLLRPDSVRGGLQSYRFAWTGNGIVGSSNTRDVTVAPLMTTRYRLSTSPVSGFQSGTCGDTTSILVRVVPRPAQPLISRVGTMLTSSATSGNQWYLNGVAIAGATGSSLTPTTSGTYTVQSSVGSGPAVCASPMSAPLVLTSSRQALAGSSLRIAPNPTPDGHLMVHLTGYRQATTLHLFDAVGRLVHTATIAAPNAQGTSHALDLSALPAGVYALRVSTVGGVDVCRLVRQ
jgi:hypothetical protein